MRKKANIYKLFLLTKENVDKPFNMLAHLILAQEIIIGFAAFLAAVAIAFGLNLACIEKNFGF